MVTFYTKDDQYLKPTELISFIYSINEDFTPRLSERVNIDAWVLKFFSVANIIYAKDGCKIVGAIVFYANDLVGHKGYITFIGTSQQYRNHGIGTKLLEKSFEIMKRINITTVGIHTNKENALELYKKTGFKLISQTSTDNTGLIRYYLEQEL